MGDRPTWEEAQSAAEAARRGDVTGSSRYNPFTGRLEGADFETNVSDPKTFQYTYKDEETGEELTGSTTSTTAINRTPMGVNIPKDYSSIRINTATLAGVYGASDPNSLTYNERVARNMVPDYSRLPVNEQNLFQAVAESTGGRSGRALYERLVETSYDMSTQGEYRSPQALAWEIGQQYGFDGSGGEGSGGSRGSGAYTGPRASITVQAESDINATANALAMEMIGRTLSEKELARVTRRIRSAEMEQPQVTTGSAARTVTTQGLTAQGREDILRDVIAQRPEFESYQLDTTVMDAMNSYIQEKRAVIDV